MGTGRMRTRRKEPSEKQKPFFDKKITDHSKFFGTNPIQSKLIVGKADEAAEKEAESASKKVTQIQKEEKKEEEKPIQKAEKKEEEKPIQKEEKKEEEKPIQKEEKKEEEKPIQKAEKKEEEEPVQKVENKEEEEPVQKAESKKEDSNVQRVSAVEENKDKAASKSSLEDLLAKRKGMGFALPDDLRKEMEGRFRTSFIKVRLHVDKEAGNICESIHARAFSHGYDIYFNEGMYNPDSLSGRELLAHELVHVVQQNG